jgi:hypothetical protein
MTSCLGQVRSRRSGARVANPAAIKAYPMRTNAPAGADRSAGPSLAVCSETAVVTKVKLVRPAVAPPGRKG